jgi:subtilisin family serine protease
MIKKILISAFFLSVIFGFSQNRKGQLQTGSSNSPHVLYVSFGLNIGLKTHNFSEELTAISTEFKLITLDYNLQLQKAVLISEDKLLEMESNSLKIAGNANAVKKLRNLFKVKIENPTNERLLQVGIALEQLSIVDYCSLVSLEQVPPPIDILPITPNFESNQSYIQENPGVNMQHAWNLNLNAQGIKLRDVEYGFNKNHEELVDIATSISTGMNISSRASVDYTEHGTSVFGILYGHKGNYGISGLAFGAQELILFPEWQDSGYDRINAVTQSIANSTQGDVIVYEMQMNGAGPSTTDYVLAEYNQVIWDLTKAATDSGIIIVAAAGNGNEDLDSSLYTSYRDRGDSGAIIVGAGKSDTSHEKLSFSTYGSRVDLQAWGENVQTIGYDDSATLINNDFNQSYSTLGGTSSATPIIASCAAVLQSYHHTLTNGYLTSQQLRDIIKQTGIAQGNSEAGNIGPIPNMATAIQAVFDNFVLELNDSSSVYFYIFPNPASNQLFVMSNNSLTASAQVEVINSLGQIVLSTQLNAYKTVDVSILSSGFYFVKISENSKSFTQKIIKN